MVRVWRCAAAVMIAGGLWGCVPARTGQEAASPGPVRDAPPQEVAAYHLVQDGREQLAGGQTDIALATFQKALALAPSSPHANLALAEAKVQQGQFRAALVYCDRVDRLAGDDPAWRWRVALIRAYAFEGEGDVVRSASEFRRVLSDIPGHPDAQAGLVRLESPQRAP